MSRQGPIDDGPAAPAGPVKLYVGQIAPNGSIRDLEDLFAKFGRILHVEIKPAGFGFVEFDDPRDAEDAVRALHDHPFEGKRLVVEFSKRSSTNNSTCFICGQTGHWVRECPENQDKGMDVRSGRCFKCGDVGHLAKYCGPNRSGARGYRDRSPPRYRSRSRSPRRRSPSPRRDYGDRRGYRGPPSPYRGGRGEDRPRMREDRSPPARYDDGPRRDHRGGGRDARDTRDDHRRGPPSPRGRY
ncbi:hypothetical protein DFJ77DRAFT_471538 [Powellomyces hirtus]|nr:hypothetical protein DFJ77DRAFT_471538 [Powellomyces hirtus]